MRPTDETPTRLQAEAEAASQDFGNGLRTQQDADRRAKDGDAVLLVNYRSGYVVQPVTKSFGYIGRSERMNMQSIHLRLPPGLSFQSRDLWDLVKDSDGVKRRVTLGQIDEVPEFARMRPAEATARVRDSIDRDTLRRLLAIERRDDVARVLTEQIEKLEAGPGQVQARGANRAHQKA